MQAQTSLTTCFGTQHCTSPISYSTKPTRCLQAEVQWRSLFTRFFLGLLSACGFRLSRASIIIIIKGLILTLASRKTRLLHLGGSGRLEFDLGCTKSQTSLVRPDMGGKR